MTDDEIRQLFTYHPPTSDDIASAHTTVRSVCMGSALTLNELLPGCPEKTLAIRKLQEAMMYANAAIAIHQRTGA